MRTAGTVSRFAVAFCFLLGACVCLHAQSDQQAQPYQPTVGQEGKDVVWVPTPQVLVDKMLEMAKVTRKDYVIDLGSGDGRTVITAAKLGARALGIEYDPDMVALSKVNAAKEGVSDKATFLKADLFETDFSQATVITMFLLPSINVKLRPKLLDMKPGTRIVSNSFDMGDWQPDQTAIATDPNDFQAHLAAPVTEGCNNYCEALFWIVPAKVAGKWRFADSELTLTQKFQMLSGTLASGGKIKPISNAKMLGEQISFRAGGTVYSGRVTGNLIAGTAKAGGKSVAWRATRGTK